MKKKPFDHAAYDHNPASRGRVWLGKMYSAMSGKDRAEYNAWFDAEVKHYSRTDISHGAVLSLVDQIVWEQRKRIGQLVRGGMTFPAAVVGALAEVPLRWKLQCSGVNGWYDLKATEGGPYRVELYSTEAEAKQERDALALEGTDDGPWRVVRENVPEDWSPYSDEDCGSLWGTVIKLASDAGTLADMQEPTEDHPDPADDLNNVARELAKNVEALPACYHRADELENTLKNLMGRLKVGGQGPRADHTESLAQFAASSSFVQQAQALLDSIASQDADAQGDRSRA